MTPPPERSSTGRPDSVSHAREQLRTTLVALGAILIVGGTIVALGVGPLEIVPLEQEDDDGPNLAADTEWTEGLSGGDVTGEPGSDSAVDLSSEPPDAESGEGDGDMEGPPNEEPTQEPADDGDESAQAPDDEDASPEAPTDEFGGDTTDDSPSDGDSNGEDSATGPDESDDGAGDPDSADEEASPEASGDDADESTSGSIDEEATDADEPAPERADQAEEPDGGDDETAADSRPLVIEATGSGPVSYEVRASEGLTPASEGAPAVADDGLSATGELEEGSHEFALEGDVTNLVVEGPATVSIDGEVVYVTE